MSYCYSYTHLKKWIFHIEVFVTVGVPHGLQDPYGPTFEHRRTPGCELVLVDRGSQRLYRKNLLETT